MSLTKELIKLCEAYSVFTHSETPIEAAKKHIEDLKKQGHKVLGSEKAKDIHGQEMARIVSKDKNGDRWVHSLGSPSKEDKKDPKFKNANSWRTITKYKPLHKYMVGEFSDDLK